MKEELDGFYFSRSEPQRGTLLALRSIILEFDPDISETLKYGMPCFLLKKYILCYLWIDKQNDQPYILMADGNRLDDPELEQGNRSRMKILRVDPYVDLPVGTISKILAHAINLHRDNRT